VWSLSVTDCTVPRSALANLQTRIWTTGGCPTFYIERAVATFGMVASVKWRHRPAALVAWLAAVATWLATDVVAAGSGTPHVAL